MPFAYPIEALLTPIRSEERITNPFYIVIGTLELIGTQANMRQSWSCTMTDACPAWGGRCVSHGSAPCLTLAWPGVIFLRGVGRCFFCGVNLAIFFRWEEWNASWIANGASFFFCDAPTCNDFNHAVYAMLEDLIH